MNERTRPSLDAIGARNELAHRIVAGFSAALPGLPDREPQVTTAILDIALLAIRIYDLDAALMNARLRAANLEAAIRAALGAQADGEPDPLAYLRDELQDMTAGYGHGGGTHGP